MKYFLSLLVFSMLIASCGSNKSLLERGDEDKALQDAIKKLNKNIDDKEATQALPILYNNVLKTRLTKINNYQSGEDRGRWDKIIDEYEALQKAYNSIVQSTPAFKLISPENFSSQLLESKDGAAADYYNYAQSYLQKQGRDNAKKAYSNFKKADKYSPNYKDVKIKINQAYENAIVNVVINSIEDDRYFFNSGWGSAGLNYSNDYFQRSLVRDLTNNNSNNKYAARFYSDWETGRDNIEIDWTVNLRLRNVDIPQPTRNTFRRERSKQIETGKDTAGKPIFQTIRATVNVTRMSFTATAQMDVLIKDIETPKTVSNRTFRETYRWEEESGTYTGDQRALSDEDWNIINNRNFSNPRREDILEELFRRIYPQVLNNIRYSVDW
ncbi:MAG: hypothetical protein WEA59_05975 [Ferruginibacter sp.]